MPDSSKDAPVILVIDDDPDVRDGLETLLQSIGLGSRTFASVTELLGSKLPNEASCLILDVRLPGLSGIDFQAELARAKIDIPIIFLSGHADIPMTVKAMKAGAVEFLTKPVREQDLLDAVQAAVSQDRVRREQDSETQDLRSRFNELSPREQNVFTLVTAGLKNKQAAGELGLSEITVKVHRHNVMKKLGAKSLAELVRMADKLGIHP